MMNKKIIILLLAVSLVAIGFMALATPVASTPSDSIIVNGADAVRQESFASSQGLIDSTVNVGTRVIAQYANSIRIENLGAAPTTLQALLEQVPARIVAQYANTIRREDLVAVPGAFLTLLGQVPDRVIFQYANTNRSLSLAYPAAIMSDTVAPQLSGAIRATMISTDSVAISWATDEFATSEVLYGTQAGTYSWTASDLLFVKQHQVTLIGLTTGTTYYFIVRSTDRSGNTFTSSENKFAAKIFVYLPLVRR
jgi:hypothetical protein